MPQQPSGNLVFACMSRTRDSNFRRRVGAGADLIYDKPRNLFQVFHGLVRTTGDIDTLNWHNICLSNDCMCQTGDLQRVLGHQRRTKPGYVPI